MVFVNHSTRFSQMNFFRVLSFFFHCVIICYKKYQINRVRFMIIFIISFTVCFLYTIYDQPKNAYDQHIESLPTHIFYPNTSIYIPLSKNKNHSHHLVLLWTDLFHDFYWHQPLFFNSSSIVSCSSTHQCQFTRDRHKASQASVIAFHLYDTTRYELPQRQSVDDQQWIFITGESPINFYYQNPSFLSYIFDNYFDRSISYKPESPYSIFAPIIKPRYLSPINIQHEREISKNSLKSKKKAIAWIVSNCNTFSQRENYVKELKKFISVDIYGRCGISCSNENNHQCQIDLNEYYFYLAFENSRCRSYITEKFWNIISNNNHRLVPIVMGAEVNDYEQIAPRHSFIHVNQYQTPKDLAKYLNSLIQNPEKYLTYLQWREHTEIQLITPGTWTNFLCPLCHMAYETQLQPNTRLNFSSWYNPKISCHHDDIKILAKCKQTTLNGWMNWIHNLNCP